MKRWTHEKWFLLVFATVIRTAWAANLDVKVEGEKFFHARELTEILPDMPEKLSEREVRNWSEDAAYEVEDFYRQSGFFKIKVEAHVSNTDEKKNNWLAVLTVSEGPHYRFGKIRITMKEDSTVALPMEKLKATDSEFYVEEDLSQDQRQITRVLGNAGFVHAKVEEESTEKDSTVDIVYRVTRGNAVVFDTVLVNAQRPPPMDTLQGLTRESLLRGLIPYERGDTLRIDKNDKVIEKLQSTGLFNSVRLEDSALGTGTGSALILNVEEKVPGHLNTSMFYETQYGFGVSGQVVHTNVAGSMKELRLGSIFAQDKQNFSAGFGSPLLWGLLLRFDDNVLVEWFQDKLPGYPVFHGDFHSSNTASLSRSFTYWLRGVSSVELDYLSHLVLDTGTGALAREKIGSLNLVNTAFISFVDRDLNPSRGVRYAATWGNGGTVDGWRVLSDRSNWLEVKSAYYYYLPPWNQFKTAFRLDGGRFFGEGGGNSNRFFLGGPRSIRSYAFEQLCPDQPPPPVGSCPLLQGNLQPAYFLLSAELRLSPFDFSAVDTRGFTKYLKPLGVVPFVDYGKVWNILGNERFSFTRDFLLTGNGRGIAFGGGIRYPLLGIFDLRVDFAWGRPSGSDWPDEWLVDLGEAF